MRDDECNDAVKAGESQEEGPIDEVKLVKVVLLGDMMVVELAAKKAV
jgi:hypothetical protein